MVMDLVSLKIGGSLITRKDKEDFPLIIDEIKEKALEFISTENIERITKEEILPTLDKISLNVISIGVGPFGHNLVNKNIDSEIVHKSVSYYCTIVEKLFKRIGLPVEYNEGYSPRHTVFYDKEVPNVEKLAEWVTKIQNNGKIALTHGDMSMDGKVVSGDQIIPYTAIKLNAKRIVSACDVDGLFTKDPKLHADAKFIPIVNSNEKLNILLERRGIDVTGRLPKKVEKFQEAAKHGISGYIVNGLKKGYLRKALLGEKTIGTLIVP